MTEVELDIVKSYKFYQKFLLQPIQEKSKIYQEYGFKVVGSVVPRDWEVLAAILLKDRAKPGYGSDLEKHEVKSARYGNSFEYQYHKNHGEQKLKEDQEVDHIFITYTQDYLSLEVWLVKGHELASIFQGWLPGLQANYSGQTPRQRYRKSIPFKTVQKKGRLLMKIENEQLIFPSE